MSRIFGRLSGSVPKVDTRDDSTRMRKPMPAKKSAPNPLSELYYALSVKQPWAALIVHGLKTVEVRSWPAGRRGTILIHASKTPELNPRIWDAITDPDVRATSQMVGGVIGCVELVDCITYATLPQFTADAARHLAGPEWFKPPRHGFVLAKPRRVKFIQWPGNTNFFGIPATLKIIKPMTPQPIRRPSRDPASVVVRLPENAPAKPIQAGGKRLPTLSTDNRSTPVGKRRARQQTSS
jgi:hypothetical protein